MILCLDIFDMGKFDRIFIRGKITNLETQRKHDTSFCSKFIENMITLVD